MLNQDNLLCQTDFDLNMRIRCLSISGLAILTLLATLPTPVRAIALVSSRAALPSNDQLDWSSLGKVFNPLAPNPAAFLANSFAATSTRGLGLQVTIPPADNPSITPPFVFQTLPLPRGIPTNFAPGDFLLFTGFKFTIPPTFPTLGNPGPISITFNRPVPGAGAQISVDDTPQFDAILSVFDDANQLLDTFIVPGTSSLALDNSAIFLGVRSDTANISRLVFSSSVPGRAIAINQLSIVGTPEPTTTCGLFAVACLVTSAIFRRQLK
jgi:hypothetical protein